jgi:hypothetical protein
MPALQHQAIVQILRDEPRLVAMLLGRIGIKTPSGSYPVIVDSDLSHRTPRLLKELRADNVFLFPGMYETIAVVVEVQTTRPDNRRLLTWPCYVTSARAVHRCKAYMLVIATSQAASFGSAALIDIGQPGFRFLPCVVGGHRRLPPGGGLVFGPELMMLNILTGGFKLSTHVARMFALASIAPASRDRRLMYAQLILEYSQKNTKTRQALEELMEDHFKDPFIEGFVEKGRAEGRMEGRVEGRMEGRMEALAGALIAVLAARSFTVLDQVRAMITACADPDQLQRWTARAVTATTIDEVFA